MNIMCVNKLRIFGYFRGVLPPLKFKKYLLVKNPRTQSVLRYWAEFEGRSSAHHSQLRLIL